MFDKLKWQRDMRQQFATANGFSTASHYANGGLRLNVLERDGRSCVQCGMSDAQHKAKWNRPITVDHKDKNKKNNTMRNLQTLCLSCHGRKDLLPKLRERRVEKFKDEILRMRKQGESYQKIADAIGLGHVSVWKWGRIWGDTTILRRTSKKGKET